VTLRVNVPNDNDLIDPEDHGRKTDESANTTIANGRKMQRAAKGYLDGGWAIVPIPYEKKTPKESAWQNLKITNDNFRYHWPENVPTNIGLLLGGRNKGLTDVDLDCQQAVRLAPNFLPSPEAIFGRPSKPRSHWLYETELWKSAEKVGKKYSEYVRGQPSEGQCLVELRTGALNKDGTHKGIATLAPPSRRKDDEENLDEDLEWGSVDSTIKQVDGDELKRCVEDLAVASLLLRQYPGEGSRHDGALIIGGALARAGWTAARIENVVTLTARAAGDEEASSRGRDAASTVARLRAGEHVYGLPKLREFFGDVVADSLVQWGIIKVAKETHHKRGGGGNNNANSVIEIDIVRASDVKMAHTSFLYQGRLDGQQRCNWSISSITTAQLAVP
jgi:Bifunctional DNA primase/polymerase, N-terminal